MTIETRAYFRRLAHTGIGLLMAVLSVCVTAEAQAPPPMTAGSLVIIPSDQTWGQIGVIRFYDGNVLALDAGGGALYQLSPGATSWSTLVAPGGMFGTGFVCIGMAIDGQGTIYFGHRYPTTSTLFWRVPYNASTKTWNVNATETWGSNITDPTNSNKTYINGEDDLQFVNNPPDASGNYDGSGTLYWGSESSNNIYSVTVDNQANNDLTSIAATPIVEGLKSNQDKIAVDVNGNIYLIENRGQADSDRVDGIFFIPSGTGVTSPPILGNGKGTAEPQLHRIDVTSSGTPSTVVYGAPTLDTAGNLYLDSEYNASYGELMTGLWMIPNECGGAKNVTSYSCLNFNHISLLSPVSSNNAIAIDSRGYLWAPSYDDWQPNGSGPYPGVWAIAVWAPSSLNLGVSGNSPTILGINPNFGAIGDTVTITGMNFGPSQGTSTVLFYGQSSTTTITSWNPTSITAVVPADASTGDVTVTVGSFVNSGGTLEGGVQSNGVNFTLGTSGSGNVGPSGVLFVNFNDPNTVTLNATGGIQFPQTGSGTVFSAASANPNPPATGASAVPCTAGKTYTTLSTCQVWVGQNAGAPGALSGQVTISGVDSANLPVSTSAYLTGTGLGPELAMFGSPLQTAVAAGLQTPAQVAADSVGDTYVADPGLKQVLMFKAGSSGASGTQIGSVWSSPTGVAVDGAGDVYVADSGQGNVTEFPFVNGALSTIGQTVASGLGKGLNLAVNGVGQAFVADPQNSRVVLIPNPAAVNYVPNSDTAGVNTSSTVTVTSNLAQPFQAPSAVAVDSAGDLFVADGTNLVEISPLSLGSSITNNLTGLVTGLAVDASGSVIVAESGGIVRIPSIGGTFTVNDVSSVDPSLTMPSGVALDQQGNLYVSDMTNGPNLYELAVTGSIDFGDALSPESSTTYAGPASSVATLYNIGNLSLNVNGPPSFNITDVLGGIYQYSPGSCDTTGSTPVTTGSTCTMDLTFTPPLPGVYSGDSMTVATNAANVSPTSVTSWLGGTALGSLVPTTTTIGSSSVTGINPPTSTYPGGTTITVFVTPAPTATSPANGNTPSGKVTLTLTNLAAGSTQVIKESAEATGTSAGTTATFPLTNIPVGNYCVVAAYGGSAVNSYQTSQSADCSAGPANFQVSEAVAPVTLSEPLGVVADTQNGIYYVKAQTVTATLTANVSSKLGTPTGSVIFTNGASQAKGGTQMGASVELDANGNAVFNTSNLNPGSYTIYANYSGDENFAAAASGGTAFQVVSNSGAVLITANPASLTTAAGTPVSSTITMESIAGFTAVSGDNLTCDNTTLPYYSECTFNVPLPIFCAPPGTVKNPCTGLTTSVLTITTNIPVNLPPGGVAKVQTHGSSTSPLIPAGIFGLGLFGLALRRKEIFNRKLLNGAGVALMLIGIVISVGGCTNSAYTKTPVAPKFTTTPGTYNVSILVTDPTKGTVRSLPFTLSLTVTQ